jgi:hypothetical protein
MSFTSEDPAFRTLRYMNRIRDAATSYDRSVARGRLKEIGFQIDDDSLPANDKSSLRKEMEAFMKDLGDEGMGDANGIGITGRDVVVAGISGIATAYAISKIRSYLKGIIEEAVSYKSIGSNHDNGSD